jgi:ATP-dependent DNA ligase
MRTSADVYPAVPADKVEILFAIVYCLFDLLWSEGRDITGKTVVQRRERLRQIITAQDRLRPLFTNQSPVENPPKIPEKIQWVWPELVCEVAFAEWTLDGDLRHTTFLGWRDNKNPEEVKIEA